MLEQLESAAGVGVGQCVRVFPSMDTTNVEGLSMQDAVLRARDLKIPDLGTLNPGGISRCECFNRRRRGQPNAAVCLLDGALH